MTQNGEHVTITNALPIETKIEEQVEVEQNHEKEPPRKKTTKKLMKKANSKVMKKKVVKAQIPFKRFEMNYNKYNPLDISIQGNFPGVANDQSDESESE